MLKDEKWARGLVDWDEEDGLKHNGWYSPSFEAIATEVDKAKVFMSLIFFHQRDYVDEETINILFASLLQFYDDFEEILAHEPTGKFTDKIHPLTSAVTKATEE